MSKKSSPRGTTIIVGVTLSLLVAASVACHQGSSPLEIDELLQNPSRYNGQLISVHGCYRNGVETTLLLSCTNPATDRSIWIEPYTAIEATEKAVPGYHARSTKTEYPSPHERELQTKLGEAPNLVTIEVVLRGEFQHSDSPLFGHTPGRRNRLILYRVLQAKAD